MPRLLNRMVNLVSRKFPELTNSGNISVPELSWEQKLGYLKAEKCLVPVLEETVITSQPGQVETLLQLALDWLEGEEEEVRVKEAAAECLGVLSSHYGQDLYNKCLPRVLELIRTNLGRRIEPDREDTPAGKLMDRKEWKNLAAWKDLDISLSCLQKMTEGIGSKVRGDIDKTILDLIFSCLSHRNRFVRDSGFRTCSSILKNSSLGDEPSVPGQELCDHLSTGLADLWPQVRLSATTASRDFLLSLPERERARHYPALLPRLCLNRYFPAEGVKLQAQASWREVCGERGRALLVQYLGQTVLYYQASAGSDCPGVREAAAHCITELVSKLEAVTVSPHVSGLLDSLAVSVEDPAWPVRDAACVAASSVLRHHPGPGRARLPHLLPVFQTHLGDSVSSVRQGAAIALANTVRAYSGEGEGEVVSDVLANIRAGLRGVREGAWELGEGCVHTVAELSKIKQQQAAVSSLLADIFQSCQYRHYPAHLQYCTTVCRKLDQIATNIEKRHLKPHLELEVIFLCLEGSSPAARAAATDCLATLGRILGPNILRGRVENLNPGLLALHDSVMGGAGWGSPPPPPAGLTPSLPSQPRPIPRANSSNFSSLGGTPPT